MPAQTATTKQVKAAGSGVEQTQIVMDGLGASLHSYRDNLGHLGGKVASLGDTAQQLQASADELSGAPHG